MKRLIVCGGRGFIPRDEHYAWLDKLVDEQGVTMIVSGGAKGADAFADEYSQKRAIPFMRVPAKWKEEGPSAGPRRNAQMAKFAHACAAFPGGKGTSDMVSRALAKGLPIFEWREEDHQDSASEAAVRAWWRDGHD